MFLVDDLLMAPAKGLLWVFKEIQDAAQQELAGEGEAVTAALSELYQKLESGRLSEAEFDAQENVLLDRLDRLQAQEEPEARLVKKPAKRPRVKRSRRKTSAPGSSAAVI
jgi:hypothetical protein